NEHLSIIRPRSKNEIDRLLEIDDVTINPFKDLLRKCRSPNYEVYADSDSYDRVVNGRVSSSDKGIVHFLAVLKPGAFRVTTILGANFESSTLYDWLKRGGCHLVENEK